MICSRDSCNNEFSPKTHNQKYCSDECCRIATNEKIKQKYYEKKARLAGKKRVCKSRGCSNLLSRYNPTDVCAQCEAKEKEKLKKHLLGMISNVSR